MNKGTLILNGINYSGGGSSGGTGGTSDYSELDNKPSINGVVLDGNKTSANLGLLSKDLKTLDINNTARVVSLNSDGVEVKDVGYDTGAYFTQQIRVDQFGIYKDLIGFEGVRKTQKVPFSEDETGKLDYSTQLTNLPIINGVTLKGNKTAEDLGLATSSELNALADIVGTVNTMLEEV